MSFKRSSITIFTDLIQHYIGSDYDDVKAVADALDQILGNSAGLELHVDYEALGYAQDNLDELLQGIIQQVNINTNTTASVDEINIAIAANADAIATLLSESGVKTLTDVSDFAYVLDEDDMGSNDDTKLATQQSIRKFVEDSIIASKGYQGGYDAATNTPDLDVTPTPGAIKKGDNWDVTTAGNFFLDAMSEGDTLKAVQDDPTLRIHWVHIPNITSSASIKVQYESNPDTNAFDDAAQTKLAGMDTGATDDQTGAEIKALYEVEANAFTDAQFTKLAGIETDAKDDQTGAEIKNEYESEPDTNAFDDAAVTKLAGIDDGATDDQTGAEIGVALFAEADINNFDDAAQTKLGTVEDNADVTDATNVAAAGATMNNEVDVATTTTWVLDEDNMASNSDEKVPTQQSVKAYVDDAVLAATTPYIGEYNASTNTPDLLLGVGVTRGHLFDVSFGGLVLHGLELEIGDTIRAKIDTPLAAGDWVVSQANLTKELIKTKYESNADTNAFTDAEQLKLTNVMVQADGSIYSPDTVRGKNLSVGEIPYTFGKDGLADGEYLSINAINSSTRGYRIPRDATIVGIQAEGETNLTKGFDVEINGASAVPFALVGGLYSSITTDEDVTAGDKIQVFANADGGGSETEDAVVTVYLKWRI